MTRQYGDHPHSDPGDGRTECQTCGKWIREVIHSCKGVPVTEAAWARFTADEWGKGHPGCICPQSTGLTYKCPVHGLDH
jgi:hypothetical protein